MVITARFGSGITVIGTSTLDKLMTSYGIESIEKSPLLSLVHLFGTNGTPTEPELELSFHGIFEIKRT